MTTPPQPDDATIVDHTLAREGLPVTEDERAVLVRTHQYIRHMTAALRVPALRDREPALIYPAAIER